MEKSQAKAAVALAEELIADLVMKIGGINTSERAIAIATLASGILVADSKKDSA